MKGFLEDTFDLLKAKGVLNLRLPAQKAIIDHCCYYPEFFGKVMALNTTKIGFIVNDMIDSKTETYPDDTMLSRSQKYCKNLKTSLQ